MTCKLLKAADLAGITGSEREELCQEYVTAMANVNSMVERKRRDRTSELKVSM